MGFKTYQAEKYIEYLQAHEGIINAVYKLLNECPISKTEMGKHLGYDFYAIHRRVKNKTLSCKELIKLLQFIK